jgi:ferredoxin-NADP reductase
MGNDDLSRELQPTRALPIVSPANMIPVRVIHRETAAPGVVSVYLVLPGTRQAPAPYLPGQFVSLALPTPRETLYRAYSLCGDGDIGEPWSLTIKRLDQGAVSTYFYTHVVQGTLLYSSLPRGTFTLPATIQPELCLVMVAAGSGITPIMGMLRFLARLPAAQRPFVHLHYASKSVEDIIFGDELADMDREGEWLRQWHYLSSERNRMTAEAILARSGALATRADWYLCGPEPLKRELQAQLGRLGVAGEYVHSEVFATAPGAAYRVAGRDGSEAGGSIRVADTGEEFDVSPQETLLAALERQGYRPSFSCRMGACGECKLRVLDGQASPVGEILSASERAAGYVLGCLAQPIGAVTLASGGQPPVGVRRVAAAIPDPVMAAGTGATRLARVAALAGASVLLLGAFSLTNHRPASWDTVQAAAPSTQTAGPAATTATSVTPGSSPTSGGKATATATGGGGGTAPTATAGSGGTGGGTGGGTSPTATPKPAPKPTPTCVSTPSKKC